MYNYPGTLIVFEGIDGCGKTSTIEEVYNQIKNEGHKVIMLANIVEDSTTGKAIRTMLSIPNDTVDDIRIINLYLSELRYAINNEINGIVKYLKEGYIVLCSRWFYSTYAYINPTETTNNIIFNSTLDLPFPDLSVYLKVEVDTAVERIKKRSDKAFDYFEKRDKLELIKKRYDTLFSNTKYWINNANIKIVKNGITVVNNSNFEYNTNIIKDLVITTYGLKQKLILSQEGNENE